ncbi:MAG: TonB family protein [Candidatus Tectimicrobiota bacterium]
MDLLSPAPDRAFRRSLVSLSATSAVVHGLVLGGIVAYAVKTRPPLLKGPIYTVNLVEIPRGARAAAMGLAPPVRKAVALPSRKTLAERSLTLPSKVKLKRPSPIKKRARPEPPASREAAPPKKTLVAAASQRGAALSVDAATFPFTYYLRAVERKISENWDPVVHGILPGETRKVVIAFRILRDGTIEQPVVEQSSRLSYFDQSALRAVLRSVPLPPLPETFPDDSLGIHFGFHYQPEG